MALNRNIQIGLSADSRSFTRDVYSAVDSLNALKEATSGAGTAVGKFSFPKPTPGAGSSESPPSRSSSPGASSTAAGPAELDSGAIAGASAVATRAGASIASIGPQIAAAMQMAVLPMQQIGVSIGSQLNIVGGAVERLSMRIDSTLKMQTLRATLTDLQTRIRTGVANAAAAATGGMTKLQQATVRLGPAADKAISAYLGFTKIRGIIAGTNSAFSKGLSALSKISFAKPIAGAAQMKGQFATMAPVVGRVTNSVKGLGLQIGLALGVVGLAYKATTALMGFFTSGIKGANNLNETVNKIKETFGDQGKVVTDLADTLGSKFGLIKGPILDAAASFGLIGKGAGMDTAAAAKMSVEMTKLAADVTSFYHIPMEEALGKIQSGLVGESKPLRDLGVLMTEDMVKAEAMALGLSKGRGELDMHAKTMARASLITKGLATASGDLERTQHDTANQFLKAGGGIQNFATTIGTMMIPTVKVAVSAFNELLASVITVFEDNRPMIQTWADTVKGAFEGAAMVLRNAGDYFTIFKLQTIENLSNILAVIETIPANLGVMGQYIQGNWKDLVFTGVDAVLTIFINLGKNIREFGTQIWKFLSDPMGGFTFNWTPLLDGFRSTVTKLPELIKPELISMQDEIAAAGQRIHDREQARAKNLAGQAAAPRKPPIAEAKEAKPAEYKATAALELGSSESGSAIAKFLNQGSGGGDAQKTAENTGMLVKQFKDVAKAIRENKNRAEAQAQGLGMFPI